MTDPPKINEQPTSPPRFRDAAGREWVVRLTLGRIDAVQDETGVDLIPKDCDVSVLTGLLFDPRQLSRVLWATVHGAGDNGITWESFRDEMDGETLSLGWNALIEGILFFIRSQNASLARTIEAAIEAAMRLVEQGTTAVCRTMAGKELETRIMEQMQREIDATIAGSVGS